MPMRIPKVPPRTPELLARVAEHRERLTAVVEASQEAADDGNYLHWDKLRHLNKAPKDLTTEEWWLALKLARNRLRKRLPVQDKEGLAFWYGLADPIPENLHHIDQDAAGSIEMPESEITNPSTRDRYVVHSLIQEAITSSQLEGATTTRVAAKQMLRSGRLPTDRSERMILNNYLAMETIRKIRNQPLTLDMLLKLHHVLVKGTLDDDSAAGRLRRTDETVRVEDLYNVVLHDPPPADQLHKRLKHMFEFANGKTPSYFIHPVIRAIILHFWLAYVHPFVDGNGRCARSLFYWSMLRQGYWLCEFISISELIRKAPAKYGRAFLYTETDENDLTYFILYHIEIIRRAIAGLHKYVSSKVADLRRVERLLRASSGYNHRQMAILGHALRHPDAEYTVKSHKTSHRIVQQTARLDLYELVSKGLLVQRTLGRTFYFTPAEDLKDRLEA